MHAGKPYSQACENNKDPILSVLKRTLVTPGDLLEIGSGTGQHAVYFARHLSHICWQPTDLEINLAGIRAWLRDVHLSNLKQPIMLDVSRTRWPITRVDYVFSANAIHIMSWKMAENMMHGIKKMLQPGGKLVLYGPFNYAGYYTSPSNAQFDQWLKDRDIESGIRDFEAVNELAEKAGLSLSEDCEMPANNRTLVWQKSD